MARRSSGTYPCVSNIKHPADALPLLCSEDVADGLCAGLGIVGEEAATEGSGGHCREAAAALE